MKRITFQKLATRQEIRRALKPSFFRELVSYFLYFIEVFLLVTVVYIFIRYQVFDLILISGKSMYPTYNYYEDSVTKDKIYIDMLTPNFSDYRRGDVVILIAPKDCDKDQSYFIKRIVGLPGEKIAFENGKVYIKQSNSDNYIELKEPYLSKDTKTYKDIVVPGPRFEEDTLKQDEYFVLGDNRTASLDSRRCGKIPKNIILGREIYRITPPEKQGFFKSPKYNIPN